MSQTFFHNISDIRNATRKIHIQKFPIFANIPTNKYILMQSNQSIHEEFVFKRITDIQNYQSQESHFIFDGIVFCICIKGYIKFKINYNEYQIGTNELFTILPQYILTVIEQSKDLELRILYLSPDLLCNVPLSPDLNLLKRANLSPCITLPQQTINELISIYQLIENHSQKDEYNRKLCHHLIYSIIIIITLILKDIPYPGAKKSSRTEILTHKFFDLLLSHYKHERNISFYADKLCVTPKYLSTCVKKITGHYIQEWINEILIIESKRYLLSTTYTIQQISEELNFQTSSSFVRFFRMHSGVTPLKYRNKAQ